MPTARRPSVPRHSPSATCCRRWSANSRSCRASWAATTRPADGEAAEVATAIDEHYLPRGAGGALPATGAGVAVALADKLDTLAGIFAIGQKPSGTKDPFGLRRAAIGALRIVIEKKLDLDLRALVTRACALQPVQNAAAANELWDYMVERLRAYFLDAASAGGVAGVTTEMFDAVRASSPGVAARFRRAARCAREIPGAARGGESHGGQQAYLQHPQEGGSRRRR